MIKRYLMLLGACLLSGYAYVSIAQPAPPTLEQNVDAMFAKSVSISTAFHDTIVAMSAANSQLTAQVETLKKEIEQLKKEAEQNATTGQRRNWPKSPPTDRLPEEPVTK